MEWWSAAIPSEVFDNTSTVDAQSFICSLTPINGAEALWEPFRSTKGASDTDTIEGPDLPEPEGADPKLGMPISTGAVGDGPHTRVRIAYFLLCLTLAVFSAKNF